MRNRFDQQLELLNNSLFTWVSCVKRRLGKATTALKEGSMEQAEKVRIADEEIDQAETDIERPLLKTSSSAAAGSKRFETDIRST